MARRQILSLSERESLLALPDDELTLTRMAYFSEHDLALISAHRKPASRFGFAVLLCYLKNVGFAPDKKISPSDALLKHIASRLKLTGDLWPAYLSGRDTTRREHLTELYRYLGVKAFTGKIQQDCITHLLSMATRTDKGILLAEELLVYLRQNNVIIPAIDVVERTCAEVMAGGDKIVFQTLNAPLTPAHRDALDHLLESSDNQPSRLTWLLQPPGKINGKNVLQHLDRLSSIESLALPEGIDRTIHQNRLLKLAREGRKMSSRDLTRFSAARRHAILVCVLEEARATLTDEVIELHERMLNSLFSKAKRTQAERLQQTGKLIQSKLRQYYEFCALSELKGALRSGDIWVKGSRRYKNFDDYLIPEKDFDKLTPALPLPVSADYHEYITSRMTLLQSRLEEVNAMAALGELPDVEISDRGVKVSPLDNCVPAQVSPLAELVYSMLPRPKITEILDEVNSWTTFTRHFSHIKNDITRPDTRLLLTTILADGINLGLTKMAEACPGSTKSSLEDIQAWYIRDETYSAALAELVNAQGKRPLAAFWGDGTTSSSDGQNFRTGSSGRYAGQVNPKYGQEPGRQFYTHISDQYSPFYTCIISRVRDSTHVLDGLLYHESDLEIREHYTDTAGFTDHVFALMHLLGFAFCPRIRDLHDKKLFIKGKAEKYPALQSLISTTSLNLKEIEIHWREVLRLATSIKQGTVTASLMLKKLASYPKQNGLAKALREIGRIERTLFMLDWFRDPALRRRVQAGLNKGEARNALARAVFMHRLGEIRDRKPENQSYRASGLTLLTAAISLWNTVYMERAVDALKRKGVKINEQLLSHLSPLGWEHINLTGDYIWKSNRIPASGKFRRLRPAKVERSKNSLNVQ
ncbi:Tn3 family transposase [Salmonella enterica subsp. enterica serovar Oranienburg]|nr:Tn3 family transposase [Salmonella enterica subsp. enterica serovar Oranienburg]EDX6968508.1 Tn3 family transposase [Salmonella enterica subsp. enterica serovar Oranienburg]